MYQRPRPWCLAEGVRGRVEPGPEVEEAGAEEVAVGRALVPIELQEGGDGLQGLADHRVVLLVADLAVEKGGDGGVEGGELGDEVVEGGRAEDGFGVAGQTVEQDALGEAVIEDEVDGGARLAIGVGGGELDDGAQGGLDPVDEEGLLFGEGVGRTVAEADDAAPPLGRLDAVLAGDDEGAEEVGAVEQVVVLGIDVDADQVGVLRRHRSRAASRSPCSG